MLVLSVGAEASEGPLNARLRPIAESLDALDFALEDRFGEVHRLSQLRGQVVVVNFWATWCGPCLAELPTMQALWERFSDGPFELLAINVGEEHSTIDRFTNGFRIGTRPKAITLDSIQTAISYSCNNSRIHCLTHDVHLFRNGLVRCQ